MLLAVLIGGSSFGPIWSHTLIEAGKQFVLGSQQRGAFQVSIRNSGPVPLSIAERQTGGAVLERGRLESNQKATLGFSAGSAALVRNLGTRQAEFDAKITNKTTDSLSMRYEVMAKE
ncbi:hypothetical protein [Hymenobacter lapidiphilus]|uniref:Uncharacterized protein n=1 Tax=Hymenobacter lapidiphilus TaxID=2608003 RepID=A0A7Y7U6C8_9BACT|nr:hypothetical protein [Hymenobacter lapidiphilus]NVO31634.1 hypothetical protein [Hymenobacter lapidiphilus]